MDLDALLTGSALGAFTVFARLGSALIFMPGFGETSVPVRQRLLFALVLSLALWPATGVGVVDDTGPTALLALFGAEVGIGLWIGLVARVILSALQFAGYQVGMVAGLSNALAPTTGAFEGATTVAAALTAGAVALIFVSDLHHVILRALLRSYEVFPPGRLMPGDLARQMVAAVSLSFWLGVSVAAPFFVMGVVLNVGMGLMNRMMATLPVFFVAAPLLIVAALALLALAAPMMIGGVLGPLGDWLATFRL